MSKQARKTSRWSSIDISIAGLAAEIALPATAAASEITLKRLDAGGVDSYMVAEDDDGRNLSTRAIEPEQ